MTPRLPFITFAPRLKAFRRSPWFAAAGILATVSVAQAADIPISGTYGTVAMCVIDAFMDVPPGDVNFNAGGAPLAHVLPGEFDTPRESCVFQKITSQSESEPKSTWVVEAACSGKEGDLTRVLTITSDKEARSLTVSDQIGTLIATLDQCSVPYAERLARELKRMPQAPKQ